MGNEISETVVPSLYFKHDDLLFRIDGNTNDEGENMDTA